jgi:hypothetical protein
VSEPRRSFVREASLLKRHHHRGPFPSADAAALVLAAFAMLATACGSDSGAPVVDASAATDAPARDDAGGSQGDGPDGGAEVDAATDARSDAPPEAGADAADADVGWLPSALPGLALWLIGDTGLSAGNVWADQSGNGNDVAPVAGSAVAVGAAPGVLNGHAVVRFPTDAAQLAAGADRSGLVVVPKNAPMGGDFLVMAVCQTVTSDYTQAFLALPLTAGKVTPIVRLDAFPTRAFVGVNSTSFEGHLLVAGAGAFLYPPSGYFADVHAHVIGLRRSAAALAFYDDQSGAVKPAAAAGDVGGELVVGGPLHGYIAELVFYAGPTADADVAKVQSYLKTKYAIAF